jgi:hypothetical protein
VLAFAFGDWHGVLVPVAAEDSAADRVASLMPVPVAAFPPVEAGFPLVEAPVSGVVAEPPSDDEVVTDGVGVELEGGDELVVGLVAGLLDPGGGVVDWSGGGVETWPELYGVALGFGLHVGELLGEADEEEEFDDGVAWPSVVRLPFPPPPRLWEPPPGTSVSVPTVGETGAVTTLWSAT